MPTPKSGIARAIEELLDERRHLTARVASLDQAIATLRDLFHLPAEPRSTPSPRRQAHAPTNGNGNRRGVLSADAITAALKAGPLAPGALAAQLGIPRTRLRYSLVRLEEQGVIVSTGTTAGRRVALAGTPAKEVP